MVPFKKKVVPTPSKKNTEFSSMNAASSPNKEQGVDNPWASLSDDECFICEDGGGKFGCFLLLGHICMAFHFTP